MAKKKVKKVNKNKKNKIKKKIKNKLPLKTFEKKIANNSSDEKPEIKKIKKGLTHI